MNNWEQIIEDVKLLPYQQDMLVAKESVVHPKAFGIPYTWGAYRFNISDGRAIDIKETGDDYLVHWEWYNPDTHLIEHGLEDAPIEWLLATTAIGALTSPEGKKEEGATRGFGLGLLLLGLRAMATKQQGVYN